MSFYEEQGYGPWGPPRRAPYEGQAYYAPPPAPMVEAVPPPPRTLATVAAVCGAVGPLVGLIGPAICWPVPAALGAMALLLALAASQVENRASIIGILGGAAALIVALFGYNEWHKAVEQLERLGAL